MYKSILLFVAILVFGLSISARAAVHGDSFMPSVDDGFYVTGLDDQYETCYQKATSEKMKTSCVTKYLDRTQQDISISVEIITEACTKPQCATMIKAITIGSSQTAQAMSDLFRASAPTSIYAQLVLEATILKGQQESLQRLAKLIQNFDN